MNIKSGTTGIILLLSIAMANAMNGKCVNALYRDGNAWNAQAFAKAPDLAIKGSGDFKLYGDIMLYTIQNNHIIKTDTLVKRSQGLCQYPAFSLDGQKVAFFHWGAKVQGSQLIGWSSNHSNDAPDSLAIVNIDGTGLTNIAKLNCHPAWNCNLFWPAGDWIYYTMPRWGNGTGCTDTWNRSQREIWRANSTTKANEKICSINIGNDPGPYAYLWHFTMSLDATRMGIQFQGENPGLSGTTPNINGSYCFPPPNGNVLDPSCTGMNDGSGGSCNGCISISGCLSSGFWGAGSGSCSIYHARAGLALNKGCTFTINPVPLGCDFMSWASATFTGGGGDIGFEVIRWAENSDRWMNQNGVSWSGRLCHNSYAVNITANEAILCQSEIHNCVGEPADGTILYGNCTGQLWIDDPVNNPNKDKYEDYSGVWHRIDTTPVLESSMLLDNAMKPQIRAGARGITVSVNRRMPFVVELVDVKGNIIARHQATGKATIGNRGIAPGSYIIRIRTGSAQMAEPIAIGL